MTSDEKQAFEELKTVSKKQEQLIYLLNKDIAELNRSVVTLKQQLSMKEIPDWAKDATAASVNKGLVDTPEGGSYDFYRILTILRRGNII